MSNKSISQWTKNYEDLGFYHFTFDGIQTFINKDGKIKKEVDPVTFPKWKSITPENYKNYVHTNRNHKGLAVITGKMSGITGLDFDDKILYYKMINEFPELKDFYTVQTNKGFHIYMNYDERIKQTTNLIKGLDIKNDSGILYAPPTIYQLPDGTIAKYDYMGGKIQPVPEKLLKVLIAYYDKDVKTDDKDVKTDDEDLSTITTITTKSETECSSRIINEKDYDKIKIYIEDGLLDNQAGNYIEWFKIGCIFKNEFGVDKGWTLFELFSKRNMAKYDSSKNREIWDKAIRNNPVKAVKLGTLIRQIKLAHSDYDFKSGKNDLDFIDDISLKIEGIDNEIVEIMGRFDVISDYDFSISINKYFGETFKCVSIKNNEWYQFTENKLWETDECGETFRKLIVDEYYYKFDEYLNKLTNLLLLQSKTEDTEKFRTQLKKKINNVNAVMKKLRSSNDLVRIMSGLKDLTIDYKFKEKINKELYVLPMKNGRLLDLKTLEQRDRNINDYFSYECGSSYIEMSKENNDFIEKYLMDLFCDDREIVKCFCDIIKSSIVGRPLRYIFFYTGEGRNGKTTLLKCIQKMMGKAMDVISKSAIVKNKSGSHLNTEIEKMDKIRIGYTDELKKTDELNTEIIKAITGGSPLNLRTLQKTDYTIIPTCTLHSSTNEMPKVDVEPATKARLKIIPFNNVFKVDASFENIMLEKTDDLFTYIMQNGNIRDNFDDVPEKMRVATQDYFENNDTNPIRRFIDDCIEFDENERIKREDFREALNNYCKIHDFKRNTDTNKNFTTDLKKNYQIVSKESNHKVFYLGIKFKNSDDIIEE